MNEYEELRRRHQEEINTAPVGYAFSNEQFDKMMQGWDLDPKKDLDKIVRLGMGVYVQKKDRNSFGEMLDRHEQEIKDAIRKDVTGEGFVRQMFLTELDNHEYGYTGDPTETFEALGFTREEVASTLNLYMGFQLARLEIKDRLKSEKEKEREKGI